VTASARERADAVYTQFLTRLGEAEPQPRLGPTRRALEFLGDPQRAYPIVHLTGTNGKTSTSRMVESILRAYGLRTGLFTSPHLVRFNERITIDGEPIDDETLARNWDEIRPHVEMVDAELIAAGEPRLTFFEVLTVLGFACFADAPVDVAVVEVGMGGEWDSTNVGDGDVAVFTPISLDHTKRLGSTIGEIAATKSGIVKPLAAVVSSKQKPEALAQLEHAAEQTESTLAVEGERFELLESRVAVGGQLISIRGIAGNYRELFLPLYGTHQAHNAAVAVAAVESFLGRGSRELSTGILEEGFAAVTSPGRLQIVGTAPTMIVDAAHNPAGAHALQNALREFFDFDEYCFVMAILRDKDAHGILDELDPIASRFAVTRSASARSLAGEELAEDAEEWTHGDVARFGTFGEAIEDARSWAAASPRRAVVVTGSITLVGDALALAAEQHWMSS